MRPIDPYLFIIGVSAITILSYFYNLISTKTKVPTVLMLIGTGVGLQYGLSVFNIKLLNLSTPLSILGNVGLIMIVLEAALDLHITKEKKGLIVQSLLIAIFTLIATCASVTLLLYFILDAPVDRAIVYSIPLSILSSAIVIPSVKNLSEWKKEFLTYESTFSDILGIMLFYSMIGIMEAESAGSAAIGSIGNIILTIIVSLVMSYGLVLVFQQIKTKVKIFLMIAILLLLYSVGKIFHLSSLFIILIFGLIISNPQIFFRGYMERFLDIDAVNTTRIDFEIITIETAFVIRTFFFIVFGLTIDMASLLNWSLVLVGGLILVAIYFFRWMMLYFYKTPGLKTILTTAPRGLITILLYYAIPANLRITGFEEGILLIVVIVSSIVMAFGLIAYNRDSDEVNTLKQQIYKESQF